MVESYEFQCWNCPEVYSKVLEITDQQEIIVSCPFCRAEAVVDLRPYHKRTQAVFKREEGNEGQSEEETQLPEILPTRKRK